MTTPPNNVEIVINEPGHVEIDQTPPPGFSISLSGPQGPKGDKGDQGIQGDQGLKGDTGLTGDKGDKGDKGDTGATGAGVPVGGTTNQVLKKNSAADYDTVWAQAPTPVPTGGSTGQVLKKNSATDYDMAWSTDNGLIDPSTTKGDMLVRNSSAMARLGVGLDGNILTADSSQAAGVKWATPTGWFRGEWVADTVAYDQGFSGGSIPSPFTGSHIGTASDPYIVATSAVGGSASPYTAAVKMQIGNINTGNSSTLTLPLASLGIAGITRIKVWTGKTDGNIDSSISKNGTAVFSQHQTTYNWTEREFAATSSDTFTFTCFGNYGVNSGTTGGLFVTGIRVYATASPYMSGQFVTYNGKLWKSTQDNNGTTPGAAGATWTEIPLNQMTGVAKDVTTTKGDILVRDATAIVRLPAGGDGQVLTADSTQAAGVKWAAAVAGSSGGGGATSLSSNVVNGATTTVAVGGNSDLATKTITVTDNDLVFIYGTAQARPLATNCAGSVILKRGATTLVTEGYHSQSATPYRSHPGAFTVDRPGAGTYTYVVNGTNDTGSSGSVTFDYPTLSVAVVTVGVAATTKKVIELATNFSKSDQTAYTTMISGQFTPSGTSVAVTAGGSGSLTSAGTYANFQVVRDGGAGATVPMSNFTLSNTSQASYFCRKVFTGLTPGTTYTFSLQVKMASAGGWQCRVASFPNDEQFSLTIENVA